MAQDQPIWLQMIYRLERAIGVPVEKAVRSDTYFDVVTHASRACSRLTSTLEQLQREWLHLLNLPAVSDVRGVREQLARVERRLTEIAKQLENGNQPRND